MSFSRLFRKVRPTAVASLYICSLFLLPGMLSQLDRSGSRSARGLVAAGVTRFAIADFDSDSLPDTATIRVARDSSPSAEYFLELRLSSGLRPAIGILGPAGGLQVTPQDVNGDKIADLVITSPFDAHFVAILLNDGEGNFRRVASSDFPNVGKKSEFGLLSKDSLGQFQLTLGQKRNTDGREVATGSSEGSPERGMQLARSMASFIPKIESHTRASRAPPLA